MNQDDRTKIASALGWKCFPYVVINGVRKDVPTWVPPEQVKGFDPDKPPGGCYAGRMPPDYPNSLEAMHGAELMLTLGAMACYQSMLCKLIGVPLEVSEVADLQKVISATAEQRATAFVMTILAYTEGITAEQWAALGEPLTNMEVRHCHYIEPEEAP
jgi:hypothetical protein